MTAPQQHPNTQSDRAVCNLTAVLVWQICTSVNVQSQTMEDVPNFWGCLERCVGQSLFCECIQLFCSCDLLIVLILILVITVEKTGMFSGRSNFFDWVNLTWLHNWRRIHASHRADNELQPCQHRCVHLTSDKTHPRQQAKNNKWAVKANGHTHKDMIFLCNEKTNHDGIFLPIFGHPFMIENFQFGILCVSDTLHTGFCQMH